MSFYNKASRNISKIILFYHKHMAPSIFLLEDMYVGFVKKTTDIIKSLFRKMNFNVSFP